MVDKIKRKLGNHNFLQNIVVLIGGNILGYGVNLVTLPLISRIYSPTEIGEYDLILSSGRFVTDIISLGLLIAIMLPREDKKAKQLCQLILALNLTFLSGLFVIFFTLRGEFQLFDTNIPYAFALVLLALYLLSYNMQSLFYSYANRKKLYRVLFWNPLVLSVSNVVVSCVLGLLGWGTAGYLAGTIFSYIICIVHMKLKVSPFAERVSLQAWKERLIEYKDLVLIQFPANCIVQMGNQIPTQYLGRVFGASMLGGYSMAIKILGVPVTLLATPINKVVYQTMSEKVSKGESIGEFLFELLEKNIKIAVFPVGLLIVFGEKLVPLLLGSSWAVAGEYFAILGIVYLLKFCSSCVSGTFVVMGKTKLSMVMSCANLIEYGICFGIAYIIDASILHTILLYALFECLYQLVNLTLCVYCTQYSIGKFIIFILKYIIVGNAAIYAVYFILKIWIFKGAI